MALDRRAAIADGARAFGITLGVAAAAIAPGRWAVSGLEASSGDRARELVSGIAADLAVLAIPAALVAAILLLIRRGGRAIPRITLVAIAFGLWIFMISSTESFFSRGVFATWVDVRIMRDSPSMMRESLAMFALRRNVVPALVAWIPVALLVRGWRMRRASRSIAASSGLATAILVTFAAMRLTEIDANHEASTLRSPFELFAPRMWAEAIACAKGPCEPRAGIARASTEPKEIDRGAAMLGWPPRADRADHPFARPMPREEAKAPRAPTARRTLDDLRALSHEIFPDGHAPVHVFQILLEGMRGDDVHAIDPAAPPNLAPFLDELYTKSDAHAPGVAASRKTWSAGLRTPHGVAAVTCGLGTLPLGLGLPRDFPELPLRCLPDVLADAGFAVGHAYGGDPSFDRIGPFLERHRSSEWVSVAKLPKDTPHGAWGATDEAVYAAAVNAVASGSDTYEIIVSLSHHHPFPPPDDLSDDVRARAHEAFLVATNADAEDERRLVTFAYADQALRDFFRALDDAKIADRSIVLVVADHAIPDRLLWRGREGSIPELQSRALVPFVMWVAPALLDGARSPEHARELSAALSADLAQVPLSQNDIPELVLSLLSEHARVGALAPDRAWHSLGGEATSPWYEPPGPVATRLHGIHAGTALYLVDDAGQRTAPDEPASLVVTPEWSARITPSLAPAAAALRYLSTHGANGDD